MLDMFKPGRASAAPITYWIASNSRRYAIPDHHHKEKKRHLLKRTQPCCEKKGAYEHSEILR